MPAPICEPCSWYGNWPNSTNSVVEMRPSEFDQNEMRGKEGFSLMPTNVLVLVLVINLVILKNNIWFLRVCLMLLLLAAPLPSLPWLFNDCNNIFKVQNKFLLFGNSILDVLGIIWHSFWTRIQKSMRWFLSIWIWQIASVEHRNEERATSNQWTCWLSLPSGLVIPFQQRKFLR